MNSTHLSLAIAVALLLGASQAEAALPNLIGHWKMDETSGTVAADSASGNDGIYQPADDPEPIWQPGLIGGAAELDDEEPRSQFAEYFEIAEITQMDGATQLTMSIWFNAIQGTTNLNDGNSGLFRSRTLQNTTHFNRAAGMNIETANGGTEWHIDSRMASGPSQNDSADFPMPFGPGWHNATMVWDSTDDSGGAGTGTTKVYVDGALSNTVSHTDLAKTVVDSGTWWIGGYLCCNGTTRGFTGLVDDVAMWDEALTDGQVAAVYAGGLQGLDAPTSLIPEPTTLCLAGILAGGALVSRRRL